MPVERCGVTMTDEDAQDRLRRTIERCGRIVMACDGPVNIGDVQEYAGLPLRVVRFTTFEDAVKDQEQCGDIWGERNFLDPMSNYFEVEVAD